MSKLTGKVAVVTGASKGIGAAIAKSLAAEGAAVVVNYASSKEGADKVVAEIVDKGGKAVAVQGSVANEADVERIFSTAKRSFGRLDILINNAGVYEFQAIEGVTNEHYDRLFDINVRGLLLATREASRYFDDAGGSIVNISSVVSTYAPPAASVYSATKGAVDTITRSLAKELGPRKIRVNSLNPGLVETEGVHSVGILGSDFETNAVAQTPLGRIGQPDDISPVAVFLASSDSGWVTGETLNVAGGFR